MDAAEWTRGVRPAPGEGLGPVTGPTRPVGSRPMAPDPPTPELRIAPSILSADFGSLSQAVDAVRPSPTGSTSTSWTGTSSPT